MKQLIQDFKTGEIKVVDVPVPQAQAGCLLVRNAWSLVSAGTERSTVSTGQKSMLGKARARPDLVKKVIDTARREGVGSALQKVRAGLDTWKMLGYSTAGVVVEVGEGVDDFHVGDRVACGGQDKASHADYVNVPANLCAPIPDGVDFRHACFTTVGVIALHGVRLANLKLGESAAVIGLGLVGQLTVQILKAAGCRVLGIDVKPEACELARKCGADVVGVRGKDDIETLAAGLTRGYGVDAVLICAAAPTNDPVELAAKIARDRGSVIMVGVTGMEIPRDLYFMRELTFMVSRSYGPGRYDPLYEERNVDYPIGYVRWTEGRNFDSFLDLIAAGRLDLDLLTTHRFKIDDAVKAYDLITGKTGEPFVGVLIEYPGEAAAKPARRVPVGAPAASGAGRCVLGVIGAGNYTRAMLLPHLKGRGDVTLKTVATSSGVSARKVAEGCGFATAASDPSEVLNDPEVNAVLIGTRHHLHARYAVEALNKGKAVFVEKPMVMTREELDQVVRAIETNKGRIQVGFNRRFAPTAVAAREFLAQVPVQTVLYRVNAGPLPSSHWLRDPVQGGGRLVGEGCHFIDFIPYLCGARPERVYARSLGGGAADSADSFIIQMSMSTGSLGTILYTAVGDPLFPKEHVEAFGGGRVAVIEDYKRGSLTGGGNTRRTGGQGQDKGQAAQMDAFVKAVAGGKAMPIPAEELFAGAAAMLAALESMRSGAEVPVEW